MPANGVALRSRKIVSLSEGLTMISVIDPITCPQCGNEFAYSEYQTRNFGGSVHCFVCGYRA